MDEDTSMRRRLAAILAADIAGYSRLMGQDEAGTVRDLKGHQAVILPLVGRHGGRRSWVGRRRDVSSEGAGWSLRGWRAPSGRP